VAGIGVIATYAAPTDYCHSTPTMPVEAIFQTEDLDLEHQTLTVYVVARTSATATNPLQSATLQLHDLRHHPDDVDARAWTWTVQRLTSGSPCPGDPNSVCTPLA
jgi:hypothetical protein